MKNLYDENDRYSEVALELDSAAARVLRPLMERVAEEGYSIRQISHIVQWAATDIELQMVITKGMKRLKNDFGSTSGA